MARISLMSWVPLLHSPLLVTSQIPMEGRSQTQMEKTCSDFFLGPGEVKVDTLLHLSCFCTAGSLPPRLPVKKPVKSSDLKQSSTSWRCLCTSSGSLILMYRLKALLLCTVSPGFNYYFSDWSCRLQQGLKEFRLN